ncbi:MAG: EAL domain-containing protein [Saprospiraceae bacterium]|nr:EAL domain-containing protein [Saprospiraceae bacterium]
MFHLTTIGAGTITDKGSVPFIFSPLYLFAIIAMAHSLGMNVVAEGVEDAAQLAFLREKKCDYLQGYYFSRPCTAEDMRDKLQAVEACDSCS